MNPFLAGFITGVIATFAGSLTLLLVLLRNSGLSTLGEQRTARARTGAGQ